MNLLVISEWFPYPPVVGAKLRALNVIRRLARLAQLDIISLVRTLQAQQVADGKAYLAQFCHSIQALPVIPYDKEKTSLLERLLEPTPVAVHKTKNLPFEACLAEAWESKRYDATFICQSGGVPALAAQAAVQAGIRPLIIDELSYFHEQDPGLKKRIFHTLQWLKYRRYTRSILRHVDAFSTVLLRDQKIFQALAPPSTVSAVIENALDIEDYGANYGQRQPNTLIFTGSLTYSANYQAMTWFTSHVWKHLVHDHRLMLKITGSTASVDTEPLRRNCPQIEFTGLVADIRSLLVQSRIAIAPLWSGGGTRIKILEALALGTPVVSTPLGAEGLEVTHQQNILLAESPGEFAECINQLLLDDALWQRLSQNGRALVVQRYDASLIETKYRQVFQTLGLLQC